MSTIEKSNELQDKEIQALYDKYRKPFIAFSAKYAIEYNDAIDIYQDAIVAVIEQKQKGKLELISSSLSTYLFAIGKFMIFKKSKKKLPIDELNEEQYLLQDWEKYDAEKDEFEIKQLQKGLNQLGEQCKKILDLFYYQSKNLAAICKLLNYENTDVVKSQKSRCLKQLKQIING